MKHTFEVTGTRADCVREIETYIEQQVETTRRESQNLMMVVEHLTGVFQEDGRYHVTFEVDLEGNFLYFKSEPVE